MHTSGWQIRKKRSVMVMLVLMVAAGIAATVPPAKKKQEPYKNLQVLPKGISSKELTHIMVDGFTDELGVSCGFCHATGKGSQQVDYASDEKPEKEIARAMMRMTIDINKKYFELKNPMIGDSVLAITCGTCHHGQAHPDLTQ